MPEDNMPEVVTDFQYDPSKPPERKHPAEGQQMIVKLAFNAYTKPRQDYIDAGGSAKIIQWRQQFEAQDVIRPDGTFALYSNTVNVTDKNGEPLGEGQACHTLGLLYEGLGVHIAPSDPRADQYLGHFFRVEGREVKLGRGRRSFNKFIWAPVMYLGTECPEIGERRVLEAREDDTEGTEAAPPVDDEGNAQRLAELCAGHSKADIFNLVMADGIGNTVSKLFGLPLIASLTGPDYPLIQTLIDKGYLFEEGNTLVSRAPSVA